MGEFRQLLLNTFSGWLSILIRTFIALALVPFLLNHLGREGYGLIGLMGVIVSMAGVADIGLRSALGRELAEQVAQKNTAAFSEMISTAFALYLFIGTILAAMAFVLAPWLVSLFNISPAYLEDAIWMIRTYGTVSVALSFVIPVFSSGLSSNYRYDIVNSIGIVSGIVSSLSLFVFIPMSNNPIRMWGWIMLATQGIGLCLKFTFFNAHCGRKVLRVGAIRFSRFVSLFHLGKYMYALSMTQTLSQQSDPLVISYFYGPSGVALYQPGARLSNLFRPVVLLLANQMYPITTKQHVLGQKQKMQGILLLGTRYTLLMGSLVTIGLAVFSKPFAKLWLEKSLGEDYKIAAYVMLGWAFADLFTYAAGTQSSVLLGMKRLTFLVWTQVPTAVLNLLVSIYFVGFTRIGIPGVLIATILIGCIRRPILIWHTAKECGLKPIEYLTQSYLAPAICFFLTFVLAYGVRILLNPTSYRTLLLCVILTASFWAFSCWMIGIKKPEKIYLLSGIRRHFGH